MSEALLLYESILIIILITILGDQSGSSEGLMQKGGRNQGYHCIIQLQGTPCIPSS